MYKFTFKCKKLISLILSLSLVFSNIPAESWGSSFLAPSGEATASFIEQDLVSAQVPEQQKNDSNITRRDFFKNTRNLAASIAAATFLMRTNLSMAKGVKKTLPKKISLKDEVSQKDLAIYRHPKVFLREVESSYDALAWQMRLADSGKPVEFGPGYI